MGKDIIKKIDELVEDNLNFNKGNDEGLELIEQSFADYGAGRSILLDKDNRIIAGNQSKKGAKAAGIKKVRIIETDGSELIAVKRTDVSLDSKKGREMAFLDNRTTQLNLTFDEANLKKAMDDFDINFDVLGGFPDDMLPEEISETDDDAEYLRKKKDFEEKMANGEISEDDEEYQEFVEKFLPKKTTDDCYTPEIVYEAIADWVAKTYNVSKSKFVRPFYPGGDYEHEKYPEGCVVVDNPPFSILSEILQFYHSRKIKFFLFGPLLTLFSSSSSNSSEAIIVGTTITYENGAKVNTSFLTNLNGLDVQFRTAPELYQVIKEANEKT